jgi:hypothetical protein
VITVPFVIHRAFIWCIEAAANTQQNEASNHPHRNGTEEVPYREHLPAIAFSAIGAKAHAAGFGGDGDERWELARKVRAKIQITKARTISARGGR